jgi:hypothetical protein
VKLRHVDIAVRVLYQDARDVNTKNSKTFPTYFFPVGEDIEQIAVEWMSLLQSSKRWGGDDPLSQRLK